MESPKITTVNFMITFLSPMVVGKAMVLCFGAMYSSNPGEGYGYGLAFAIVFTLAMLGRFLWKFRHHRG